MPQSGFPFNSTSYNPNVDPRWNQSAEMQAGGELGSGTRRFRGRSPFSFNAADLQGAECLPDTSEKDAMNPQDQSPVFQVREGVRVSGGRAVCVNGAFKIPAVCHLKTALGPRRGCGAMPALVPS